MRNIILVITMLLIPMISNSGDKPGVYFTEEEAKKINEQLDKDKKIILWQANRWKKMVNTPPKIHYKITDSKVVIQKIEFPVKNDKPLIYTVKFEVNTSDEKVTFFPLLINLGVMVEGNTDSYKYVDPKLGIQVVGLKPINVPFIRGLGFHILAGIKSAGLSMSWGWMKKPIKNLRLHFYTGVSYKGRETFGGGITLNF